MVERTNGYQGKNIYPCILEGLRIVRIIGRCSHVGRPGCGLEGVSGGNNNIGVRRWIGTRRAAPPIPVGETG